MADVLRSQPDDRPPLAAPPWPRARRRRGGAPPSPPQTPRVSGSCSCPARTRADALRRGAADGFRCARCEAARRGLAARRSSAILVEEAGGACVLCGYARVHRRPAVPSRRSGPKSVRAEPRGRHALARQGPGGSREVRAPVRELPREVEAGLARTSPKIGRSRVYPALAQARTVRGSSMAEHSTVNRRVVGSSPTPGARPKRRR